MKRELLIVVQSFLSLGCLAQINYSGGLYTQDFNTLQSGAIYLNYTTMPTGWVVSRGSYVWTSVTNGYSNNYGTYCFSLTANDPDKAIGLVIGTTGPAYLGAQFRNTTGVTLTSFTLSYFTEQWSKGAIAASDQVIPFEYGLGAASLTSGTYVAVTALDMHSIYDGDGTFAAMNGHAAANRQLLTASISGISWLPGQDLWIRWKGVPYNFFAAHALAIDDVAFRAVPELRSSLFGGRLQISWSTNDSGYILQSAFNPAASSWDTVTNMPVISASQFQVDLETSGPPRFFRLLHQ